MVISVDVQFIVKSTNEHTYHRTVYSYRKAYWARLRDLLRDVLWLDIFKHDATYAAEEITESVKIGIDCYIPQKAPLLTMLHTTLCCSHCTSQPLFPSVPWNASPENKKLFMILKQLVALLHLSLSDLMTSGGFATTFSSG